jgi:hypothetical protein
MWFNPQNRRWYVGANAEDVRSSSDGGLNWTVESGVTTAGAGENCFGGDANTNGDMVVCTDSRYIFSYGVGGSWTKVDCFGVAITNAEGVAVVWDPVHSLWCCSLGKNAGVEQNLIRTSSNRTSWTARTGPVGWTYGIRRLHVKKSTGRIVGCQLSPTSNQIITSYSDDGGITWVNQSASPLTWSGNLFTELGVSYNETTNTWLITAGEIVFGAGAVWRSTDDGVTWTKIETFFSHCPQRAVGVGKIWVTELSNSSGLVFVAYSLDDGATWTFTDQGMLGLGRGMFEGGGRLMALTNTNIYRGLALGRPFEPFVAA